MALHMSKQLGWLTEQQRDRGISLLKQAKLPIVPPLSMTAETFLTHMAVDKKNIDGHIRLVLLRNLGEALVTAEYPAEVLHDVLSTDYSTIAASI